EPRDVGRDASGAGRGGASGGGAGERLLPLDAAEVDIEGVDLVRGAADEAEGAEAAGADVAGHDERGGKAVRLARRAVELHLIDHRETGLGERGGGDLLVGAHPAGALRVAARGVPFAGAASELGARGSGAEERAAGDQRESSSVSSHPEISFLISPVPRRSPFRRAGP